MVALAATALLGLVACSSTGSTGPTTSAVAASSVADPWTTPPAPGTIGYPARPTYAGSLQSAPRAVAGTTWSGYGNPPPPPPPDGRYPVVGQPRTAVCAPTPVCAPVARPAAVAQRIVPQRCYTGCGLPCADGISQWHVRAVGGPAFYSGDDAPEDCGYLGVDVGRTFCGCWGLDAYYRYNTGRFDRYEPAAGGAPARAFKDGGNFHHIGAKLTYEGGFGKGSRFYGWGGVGGGYFTTTDFLFNDSGGEVFGEAGIGYVLHKNWRVRAGVNAHGMDTDVTRSSPPLDGQSRWLWTVAPVVEVEADF